MPTHRKCGKNDSSAGATVAFKPTNCLKHEHKNNASNILEKRHPNSHSKNVRNFCDISYEKVKRHKLRFAIFFYKVNF